MTAWHHSRFVAVTAAIAKTIGEGEPIAAAEARAAATTKKLEAAFVAIAT